MGLAIYYTARRLQALSEAEQMRIASVIDAYSIREMVDENHRTEAACFGEDFVLYSPPFDSPDVRLQGATKLPDATVDVLWDALQHWCKALSEIRRLLPDAVWHVHLDDNEIRWDEGRQEFAPSV